VHIEKFGYDTYNNLISFNTYNLYTLEQLYTMKNIITLKDRKVIQNNNIAMWFDRKGSDFSFEPGQYARITLLEPMYEDKKVTPGCFR